ncbi:MAG: ATP-binding protein [Lachnospiraceae bacterium]|nr:ATP-binding protein [Lachnospiraceae bacterium]
MGIYLNPGNKGFQESVCSEIYVDKTGLIEYTNKYLNTKQKHICVSRPRRFGKSMALEMLSAYYSRGCDSREMFHGLKIEAAPKFGEHLNMYDVIYLNMQQFLIRAKQREITEYLEEEVLEEVREEYGEFLKRQDIGLADALRRIYAKTERTFIFLIDEWDCVMRERQDFEEMQKQYLDFLRDLLKDQPYVALAYMTGILPIKKYGVHSALNMFTEYSMVDQDVFEEYTGFTEAEVKALCSRYHMNFEDVSSWYDGYELINFQHVYNPKSVVEAVRRGRCSNYWTATETYEALKKYINMNLDGLRDEIVKMLGRESVPVRTVKFKNDMRNLQTKDDVLTLLIHLGYLAYDSVEERAFIPNNEIMGEFENAISDGGSENLIKVIMDSERLLQNTLNGRESEVAAALDRAHTEIASNLNYNDEFALGCAVILAYWSARKDYKIIRELPVGYGYADIVFLPLPGRNKPAIVVELKYNKAAQTAIQQIKDKKYADVLRGYSGEVILVGINYDKDRKDAGHSCRIERMECSGSDDVL